MDQEAFNTSIRKFLKTVGVTSQREIETQVREALAAGRLGKVHELGIHATITLDGLGAVTNVDGKLVLGPDAPQG